MTRCTTWHVRIDLVDDGTEVSGRVRLVGAPGSMTARQPEGTHAGCVTDPEAVTDPDGLEAAPDLGAWRSVGELPAVLLAALAREHLDHPG